MFNIFKRKKIKLNMVGSVPNETPKMLEKRTIVTKKVEDLLGTIDDIRLEKDMTPQEKYAIMMASLYIMNKISSELLNSQAFFENDKQFKNINRELDEELKKNIPNYIG